MITPLKEYNERLRKIFDNPTLEPIEKLKQAIDYNNTVDKIEEGGLFKVEKPS